jgi:hypothetical protein
VAKGTAEWERVLQGVTLVCFWERVVLVYSLERIVIVLVVAGNNMVLASRLVGLRILLSLVVAGNDIASWIVVVDECLRLDFAQNLLWLEGGAEVEYWGRIVAEDECLRVEFA